MMWRLGGAVVFVALIGCGNTVNGGGDDTGVGPEGGQVQSSDGNATLVIPAGALSSRVDLAIAAIPAPGLDAAYYAGSYYRVTPAGVSFAQPATLTIVTDSARGPIGTSRRDLAIERVGGNGQITSTTPTAAAGTAVATIGASGDFGVLWRASAACPEAERRQFDFWLGHWRYEVAGGAPGDQTITAEGAGGCALREQFVQGTYRGSSVNHWANGVWYQTYIDTQGARTILRGAFTNGTMILNETPTKRFLWRATSATVVSFVGEESSDGGTTWRQTFSATYTKIP